VGAQREAAGNAVMDISVTLFYPLLKKEIGMSRRFAIVGAMVVLAALAANVQAQGPGGNRGGMGGMGGMMGGGQLALLQNEAVQKEIELVPEQKEKLTALGTDLRTQMQGMRDLSQEERTTKMREITEGTQKKVEGILLPHQLERIKQISLQMQGIRALSDPAVAKELGLTEDQQSKIKTINDDAQKARRELFGQGGGGQGGGPGGGRGGMSQENMQKMQDIQKDTETKLTDVLTSEQKEKLEKMKGPKFDTTALRGNRQGGNRGNRGGAAPTN
jgi:Spy/CpxP family protein refolding chaperone